MKSTASTLDRPGGRFEEPITVIVPARDEAENIEAILAQVRPFADELLVVDGHSTDGTAEVAAPLCDRVLRDNGRGKGDGLRCGVEAATHDIVVFIDADFSHDPQDIPRLVAPLIAHEADHVQGSRMLGGSDELFSDFGNYLRLFGSVTISMGINYRFGAHITDSQNGFRAMRKWAFQCLDTKEDSTTIEQEMIIKTLARGLRLIEIPTHEYPRRAGDSKIVLRKVWVRYVTSWLKHMARP